MPGPRTNTEQTNSAPTQRSRAARGSIFARLFYLVAGIGIPLAILAAILSWLYADAEKRIIEATRNDVAANAIHIIDGEVARRIAVLSTLAGNLSEGTPDPAQFHRLATKIAQQIGEGVVLLDRSGQQLMSTRVAFGETLPVSANMAELLPVFETGKPYTSNILLGTVARQHFVVVAVPVIRNGETVQALVMAIMPSVFEIALKEAGVPPDWIAAVIDRNGDFIGRSRTPEVFIGKPARPELIKVAKSRQRSGNFANVTHEGVEVESSFRRSMLSDWTVVIAVPTKILFAPLYEKWWLIAGSGIATVLLSLLLAAFAGRKISTPVFALQDHARALAQGERFQWTPRGVSEIDDVGKALEQADASIREREMALRESEASKASVISTALDCILTIDEAGNIVDFNPAAEMTFGHTRDAVLGRPLAEVIIPRHYREAHSAGLARHLATGESRVLGKRLELEALRADGTVFPVELSIVRSQLGERIFFTGHIRDISDRKLAEKTIQEKLQQHIEEREKAEDQLRQMQKMEAVGQLTGGIAHDFNNMLAVILGSLKLFEKRQERGDADAGKFIKNAIEGAERAATLTRRLLAFSRQQALSPQVLDGSRLVSGMSEFLRRAIPENIEIESVLAGGLWKICADQSELENAILNLSLNARDAMAEGGKITIETANTWLDDSYASEHPDVKAGQYVMIAVTDNGVGMAPNVAARAFDPFFTTKPTGKGTGLGLSQVYGFIKQSGGHIKIYSEVGHGTAIKIYLPRHIGENEQPVLESIKPVVHAAANEKILLVEDDDRVRHLTAEMLEELGYRVLAAANSAEALALLDQNSDVDLLFTDIVMPGINGRQLADEALKRRPALNVLFATGYTRNAIVHNGILDVGVNVILKPYTMDALAAKLASVLRGQ
jgi:PAS domain S-box-containing protein